MRVRLHTQDLKLVLLQPDPTTMQQEVPNEDLVTKEQEDPFTIHRDLVTMDKEDQVTMCLGYLLMMHLGEELAMMLNPEVWGDMLRLETPLRMGLQHRLFVVAEETPAGDEPKVPFER